MLTRLLTQNLTPHLITLLTELPSKTLRFYFDKIAANEVETTYSTDKIFQAGALIKLCNLCCLDDFTIPIFLKLQNILPASLLKKLTSAPLIATGFGLQKLIEHESNTPSKPFTLKILTTPELSAQLPLSAFVPILDDKAVHEALEQKTSFVNIVQEFALREENEIGDDGDRPIAAKIITHRDWWKDFSGHFLFSLLKNQYLRPLLADEIIFEFLHRYLTAKESANALSQISEELSTLLAWERQHGEPAASVIIWRSSYLSKHLSLEVSMRLF